VHYLEDWNVHRHLWVSLSVTVVLVGCFAAVSCGSEEPADRMAELGALMQNEGLGRSGEGPQGNFELAASFSDVSGDERENEIVEAARLGFVSGFPDGSFQPRAAISREQMAAVLFNALSAFGLTAPASRRESPFSDVPVTVWSYRAVDILHQLGVVSGLPGGRFEPSSPVTRAQVAAMVHSLLKAARQKLGKNGALPIIVEKRSYADMSGHWAARSVSELSGYCHADTALESESSSFSPDDFASRSLATGSLVRAYICLKTGALPVWVSPEVGQPESLEICEPVARSRREVVLRQLTSAPFGRRPVRVEEWSENREACVLGLIPAALYVNLRTGVPASTLVGQAIQETGWCRSQLALEGLNFHGQKAKFPASSFRYWDGSFIWINSTESPTGEGNKQLSKFMAFQHPDHSFYSVAERFILPGLPYNACMNLRSDTEAFTNCIGKTWAVHSDYAQVVRRHVDSFRSSSRPNLRLRSCDLRPDEWRLDASFAQ
jgi:flagellum-specific peptidoglycan hydrolase FlgJ